MVDVEIDVYMRAHVYYSMCARMYLIKMYVQRETYHEVLY